MNFSARTCAAIAAAAAILSIPFFSACAQDNSAPDTNNQGAQNAIVTKVENDYDGYDYVFTVTEGVIALDADTMMYDYLCALQDAGKITFTATDGSYGKYITAVEGTAEKTESDGGYSWMIYTTLTELDGVIYSDASYTWEYAGKTLNSASWGVSALPAVEGCTYALVYSHWSN